MTGPDVAGAGATAGNTGPAPPRRPRIYLAGPDVFLPGSAERGARLKALCRLHGADGMFPIDDEVPGGPGAGGAGAAARIRSANLAMIRACDAVVANMAPFRGPAMDGGTAYEMGFAAALGRIVVGYQEPAVAPFHARVAAAFGAEPDGAGELRDRDGMLVEAFPDADGRPVFLADNLMMACGLDGFAVTAEAAIMQAVAACRLR